MKTKAKTPQRSRIHGVDKTTIAAGPALTGHRGRRQLERSVSLTGRERLRCLWYRLRLTIAEMNYATRRLTEMQSRLP